MKRTPDALAAPKRPEAERQEGGGNPRRTSSYRRPVLAGLIAGLIVLAIGVTVIALQPSRYTVTSTVSFAPRSQPNVSAEVVQLAATKYAVTAGARTTLDFAADRSAMTTSQLRDRVSVSVQQGTANVDIEVEGSNAAQGARAANALASSVAQATADDELIVGEVTAPADPDAAEHTPSRPLLLTVAIIAAVLVAGWVGFAVRHLDRRAAKGS
ncbi:hypothetical protein [Streptomyces sp. YS415]|uniref:hypothetical protein n=1 Tax=Streptomyces sp. YS415 TaxID=2944806 RepID=UPI002021C327|nr:hypothetical protein [Streptomyces sp. YS415]MCL7425870.1 hypothetical protein [Streptomyces sp. YS415]